MDKRIQYQQDLVRLKMAELQHEFERNIVFGFDVSAKTVEAQLVQLPEVQVLIPSEHLDRIKKLAASSMDDDRAVAKALMLKYVPNLEKIKEHYTKGYQKPTESCKMVVIDFSDDSKNDHK